MPSQNPNSHPDWADLLARDRGAFMRAFARGDVDTDAIAATTSMTSPSPTAKPAPNPITATFTPSTASLSVTGDARDNGITLSRDGAGKILVNDGTVPIKGGTSTVANTTLIQVYGQDGADVITLNEANGA